jgi:hypothetical protein
LKQSVFALLSFLLLACGGQHAPVNRVLFEQDGGGDLELRLGERSLLRRSEVLVKTQDGEVQAFPLSYDGSRVTADLGDFGQYTETLVPQSGSIRGEIQLTVQTDTPFAVHCPFEMDKPAEKPYFMIPGFLYGSNNLKSSRGRQPKLDYGGAVGYPASSMFYTRADRSPHPGVIVVSGGAVFLVGIREVLQGARFEPEDVWSSRYVNTGLFLDTSGVAGDALGFTLGYEHSPRRYRGKTNNADTPTEDEYRYGWITGLKGKTLTVRTFYFADFADRIPDHSKAIRAYYYELHEAPKKVATRQEALEKITRAHVEDAWQPDRKVFYLNDNYSHEGNIAWTGGMQDAYPLLKAGLRLGNKEAQAVAQDFIHNLAGTAMNEEAGLLFEASVNGEWKVSGWWGYPTHSAYLNGQASYYLLKSYLLTGGKHQAWLETARQVLETALASQNSEGAYASQFDPENGKGVDYDAFQSCWFVPGMAVLADITGEERFLESALKALNHYNQWHQRGELYGTPMDTGKAVDEEGNLAFLSACAELHRLTKRPEILRMAEDGLNWEFSWKFAYNTVHTNEPLKSMDWSSAGGSITSTHNVHIHQMGNLVAGDIYYLYTQIGDQYIADRLRDTCIWGLGTFNRVDGEFSFGKAGWGTEQFFHSDGLQDNNLPWDGGIWKGHIPWAVACVLLNCAEDIPDSFFGE